jgi:hypothetical protein
MAITVGGPNGITVDFPDGTSTDVINSAMASQFGTTSQPQSVGSSQPDTSHYVTSTGQTIPSASDRAAAPPVVSPDSGAAQMMPSGVALGTEAENRNRAFTSGRLIDRAVAAGQTYLPPSIE